MTLMEVLAQYGYYAVFVGTVLEGETILILAGFLAHQGYMSLPAVVALAFCGGTLGDQIVFFLGRRYGIRLLRRWPSLANHRPRISRLIHRHQIPLIMGVRFLYGMRIAGPILIGMSRVRTWRFVVFNMLGAAVWAIVIAGLGYVFGQTLQYMFTDMKHYERLALGVLIGAVLLFAVGRWLYGRWRNRTPNPLPEE